MAGWKRRWADGRMAGSIDGQMGGWPDGRMDGWIEPARLTSLGPRLDRPTDGRGHVRTRNSDTPSPLLKVWGPAEPRVQVRQCSDERASGWTDARTGGWKNSWMDGGVGKGVDGQARRLTHECTNARMGEGVGVGQNMRTGSERGGRGQGGRADGQAQRRAETTKGTRLTLATVAFCSNMRTTC